ncbi:MAG TPA: MFS transporter [Acetobacteraceae bacterium]
MPDELRPDIPPDAVFATDVPARLDRLPWSRFHWLVIISLGIAWVLDGLEVTIVGSLSGALTESPVLHLTAEQVGLAASAYLIGAVVGALFFGWLTDRLGRKKLFSITVLVYLTATVACGLSWNFWSFAVFRMLTGAGIGGEYAAVNATIQELIPARRRGFTDLVVNGSFWLGAALGAIGALVVLDPAVMPAEYGWRFAFILGGVLGLIVLLLRRFLPESPRWLMTHGDPEEAERVVAEIERRVERETGRPLPPVPYQRLLLRTDIHEWFGLATRALFSDYRRRAILGIVLMAAQAFCYNAVFFTYALILKQFYGIRSGDIGWFLLPFAAGNFLGPLVLGRLFDTLGRRLMITLTYALSGILMALTGWLFVLGVLDAVQQTLAWTAIFFVASAAASSAYLTVGESFPLEMRAIAIALFYAFGTGVGGVAGPALFGALIDTGERVSILWGYLLGGGLMVIAAVVAAFLAVPAERRALEDIAPPLSSAAR